jgi:hypothetical protein
MNPKTGQRLKADLDTLHMVQLAVVAGIEFALLHPEG